MENDKIAVIMSAYNEREEWLRESIDSILNQTYQNLQLYIVLDNPQNEVLDKVITSYAHKDKRITYLKNEKNMGLVRSLNRVLTVVTESYVARMDADDIAMPERLEKEMQYMKEYDIDFVLAGADFLYENGEIGPGDDVPMLLPEKLMEVQKYGNVSIHSSWLLKKEVYDYLGGYREIKYCEDLDFVLRAIQFDYRVGRMKEHLILYRLRSSGVSMAYAYEQMEKANYLRREYKNETSICNLNVDFVNRPYKDTWERKKEAYAKAKVRIDKFCDNLYRKKYLSCIGNLICGMLFSASYRKIFVRSFYSRIKLNRIYQIVR